MEPQQEPAQAPKKKTNKKIVVGGIVALFALAGIFGQHPPTQQNTSRTDSGTVNIPASNDTTTSTIAPKDTAEVTPTPPVTTPAPTPVAAPAPAPKPAPTPKTCSAGYYLNVDGNCIQSPTAAPSAPAGATAECRDGTYSFSQNHSGTCSHHGGVARWL